MQLEKVKTKQDLFDKWLFLASITILIFRIVSKNIDVYEYAVVGAIFEVLSMPMALSIILVPIASFILWAKTKFYLKNYYLVSILITLISSFIILTL